VTYRQPGRLFNVTFVGPLEGSKMKSLFLLVSFFSWLTITAAPQDSRNESHVPPLHNECLAVPKYVSASSEMGYVVIENICPNSISARMCTKYSKTGWFCRLYPAVLPHGVLKSTWSVTTTGSVSDVKAWATDYASGSHADDYKNLPTVKAPNTPVLPR
jgi:hypothetical protein